MSTLLYPGLCLLLGALFGWLISLITISLFFKPASPAQIAGLNFQGILPSLKPLLIARASELVKNGNWSQKINNPQLIKQLLGELETHVDGFLKTKLKEAFPLLSNFMGEKTLSKFKDAFMTEAADKLPLMIQSFAGQLSQHIEPARLIDEQMNTGNAKPLVLQIKAALKQPLILLQVLGALIGTVASFFQLFLYYCLG